MIHVICTTLLVEKSPQALPLGAACIASAIKNSKLTRDLCTVELISFSLEDTDLYNQTAEQQAQIIYKKLISKNPGIVCLSTFVWNRIVLEIVSQKLKSDGIKTIAGGPEITAHPETFKETFDYLVCGEGEVKVPEIISNILSDSIIDSVPFVRDSQTDKELKQIDSVPIVTLSSPYLDGTLDPAEYGGALWELARGCPFKCSYCYESKGEKTVRQFPIERIEKELDLFAKKKVPQVFVLDPTYNANKQRAIQLLNLIAKKTPDTFYYFEARAEFIDRQLAKAFTKIPCALQIGLQSASEEVLRLVNRPFNRKQFVKNINLLNEEGVIFGLDLIYGLPGETFRTFKEGIDFAVSLYPNNLEIFCLSVLPGTDLYDRASALQLTFDSEPPYHIIHTDRFSNLDIKQAGRLANACNYFYNQGRAVPWFNTMLKALRIKPSGFFGRFADYMDSNPEIDCKSHKEIEKHQIKFISELFKEKHMDRYQKAAADIIRFNGALSRKTDSGKSEELILSYPAEYIDSEYALDLEFFVNNVKMKNNKVRI